MKENVEGPKAQKGGLALELTMATKRAPTTQHRHTEEQFSGILTTTHTYLSRGREEWEQKRQILQSVTNNDPQRSQSKAKHSKAEICKHMSAPGDCTATPHRPAFLGLNR